MDTHRVHLIYQYSLSIAAQNDDWQERELGPIHLVKYLYLADLAYASAHGGETYTGIPWRFHKFGLWAECAFFEIDPALTAIKAEKKKRFQVNMRTILCAGGTKIIIYLKN